MTAANKIHDKLEKLVRMLGSDNVNERENARRKIDDILVRNKWTWNDLPELFRSGPSAPEDNHPSEDYAPNSDINPFDLVHYILQQYVALTPHEYVAVALWVVHTHVYDRFMVTPRLAVTSPVRGCGKTILLSIISSLAARVLKTDGITPAAIYRLVDAGRRTLLVDEADNLGLGSIGPLRAVLNSGRVVSPRASSRGTWPRCGFGRERFGRFPAVHNLEVSRAITGHTLKPRGSHIARTERVHS